MCLFIILSLATLFSHSFLFTERIVTKFLKDTEAISDTVIDPSKGKTISFLEDSTTTTLQETLTLLAEFDYNVQTTKKVLKSSFSLLFIFFFSFIRYFFLSFSLLCS